VKILLTGGSGRLGTELRALLPNVVAPTHAELDITNAAQVDRVVAQERPELIIHAAAYTDVAGAERQREACWKVNVEGTRHVVHAANALGSRLVYISTDYVFDGIQGGYREEDSPGLPVNYYGLTKLVAEEAARAARRHLIIRTSFRPRMFPYAVAYSDAYTSQDYVDLIAPEIALAVLHVAELEVETLHIATERKSVFELARRRSPEVQEGSRTTAGTPLPRDVSLNVQRWQRLKRRIQPTPNL
jgi:dTDP-4-dehydrorhamnose reductase